MKKPVLSCALLCASLLGLSLPAHAATPVTYSFEGAVDFDEFNRSFISFSGSFTFDADVSDGIANPSTAAYAHNGSPWGLTISFDGGAPFTYNTPFNVLVSNNLGGSDQLGLLAQGPGSQSISLTLTDTTAGVFASDALPLPPGGLTLPAFTFSTLQWDQPGGALQGHLTSLSLVPAAPVPEAGTLAMMLSGGALLAATIRRRNQRR